MLEHQRGNDPGGFWMSITAARFALAILLLSILADQAAAIIVRADAPPADVLADSASRPEVVALLDGRAVGTLVTPRWIVTAAHVGQHIDGNAAGQPVVVGGMTNTIVEVVLHPNWDDENLGAPAVVDIALLRLDKPVTGVQPARVYGGRDELQKIVLLYGWGRTGDGLDPELQRDGLFRHGRNKVDSVTPRIRFRFDEPDSENAVPLEAVSGPGDSGGPAFIDIDGTLFLAGISSYQEDEVAPGLYGVIENYERVSDHIEWINAVINADVLPDEHD
jgi:hypothetical protein